MVVGLKSPWRASSLEWATSCQVREKMRSFSSSRIAGSVYIDEGSVCARATSVSGFISEAHSRTRAKCCRRAQSVTGDRQRDDLGLPAAGDRAGAGGGSESRVL